MTALTIVAHSRPYVIGVDCHARTHTYAIIGPFLLEVGVGWGHAGERVR